MRVRAGTGAPFSVCVWPSWVGVSITSSWRYAEAAFLGPLSGHCQALARPAQSGRRFAAVSVEIPLQPCPLVKCIDEAVGATGRSDRDSPHAEDGLPLPGPGVPPLAPSGPHLQPLLQGGFAGASSLPSPSRSCVGCPLLPAGAPLQSGPLPSFLASGSGSLPTHHTWAVGAAQGGW